MLATKRIIGYYGCGAVPVVFRAYPCLHEAQLDRVYQYKFSGSGNKEMVVFIKRNKCSSAFIQ